MRCFVTGGAGFIGSYLVRTLLDAGHSVVCVDNESSEGHESFAWDSRATNINKDVNDLTALDFQQIDVVFHLAAEVSIQRCISNPSKTLESNVAGTFNVLNCASVSGVKRVVFSSSSSVYGLNEFGPAGQNESSPIDCLNIYATSKLMGEQLCKLYGKATDSRSLDTVCLRYFNVYGEGQSDKGQYCPVVAVFRRQKKEGIPLTVVGDGLQTRDYIHVSDVVSANITAATLSKTFKGEIYNIGTGTSYSVLEIANTIAGKDGSIEFLSPRTGEARHTRCNYAKAFEQLLWLPKVNLMDWLKKTA
jgi:UDP-glucose 4-epimerase